MPIRKSISKKSAFSAAYPEISAWVENGLIEIGHIDYTSSFIRAIDEGGIVWEGKRKYHSLDDALAALESGLAAWRNGGGH
jgi:hypothetical protein